MFMNAKQLVKNHLESSGESIQSFVERADVGRSSYYDLMLDRHVTTVPVLQKILRACGYELTITAASISEAETPIEHEWERRV